MNLFSSLEVNDLVFSNRVVVPPMATNSATEEGKVTDETLSHYRKISEDPGLTIVEHSFISKEGRFSDKQLGAHKDKLIERLSELAKTINKNNSISCLQINHAGYKKREDNSNRAVNTMNHKKLERTKENFVSAAKRIEEAGFDALEIHGAHGFLLSSFLSPLTNHREDKYGGELHNRMIFPLEVVEEVKEAIDDLLLLFRLGATDLDPNGLDAQDSVKIAKELIKQGVNVIDVSGATCGSRPQQFSDKQGYFVPVASEIRGEINKPVIGVGGIKEPKKANKFIKNKYVDFVAIGREMLNNPDWVKEAKEELS